MFQNYLRPKISFIISLIFCFFFTNSATPNPSNGISLERWKCFKPQHYNCKTYKDLDEIVHRLTAWDERLRKSAFQSMSFDNDTFNYGKNCNRFLYNMSFYIHHNYIQIENKQTTISKLSNFLLHNFGGIKEQKEENLDILLSNQVLSMLDNAYLGSWIDFASHSGNDLAQCLNAIDRLKNVFKLEDRDDVTWRKVHNLNTMYTSDILNQNVKHSQNHWSWSDLELSLYWLKQAAQTNEYANQIWSEIGRLYQGSLDNSKQLSIEFLP